jgi:hypothetical protein
MGQSVIQTAGSSEQQYTEGTICTYVTADTSAVHSNICMRFTKCSIQFNEWLSNYSFISTRTMCQISFTEF